MAVSNGGGPLDGFRGRIGNVIIYDLNGQRVMRTVGKRTTPFSIKEKEQHSAYALLNDFLSSFIDFYKAGFAIEMAGTTSNAYNMAIKYNYGAIISDSSGQHIDYTKVLVTKGKMEPVEQLSVKAIAEGLEFNWDPSYDFKKKYNDDQVMILLCAEEPMVSISVKTGALRETGKMVLEIKKYKNKLTLHAYVSFISSDRKSISNSQYIGKVDW